MNVRRNRCLLCGLELEAIPRSGAQRHPKVETCLVTYTDAWGVSLTDEEAAAVEVLIDEPPPPLPEPTIGLFDVHPPVDWVLDRLFEAYNVLRLGGASTGKGWSSYATAQRCLYLWERQYVSRQEPDLGGENDAQAIGSVIHVLLALHYMQMLDGAYPISPEACFEHLIARANPVFVNEGYRVFKAYRLYYAYDDLQPLAVEYDLKDPRTGESTRYDLIAYRPKPKMGYLAGTYIIEHKSSGRFDYNTIEGWGNDGEVIGEAALWRRLGLDKRFGPLRGVIVNLVGKQKDPQFHRTTIAPDTLLIDSHLDDLRRWDALISLCRSAGFWPRSRANCVNRWGRCKWWDHCMTGGA